MLLQHYFCPLGVSQPVLVQSYTSITESILTPSITVWYVSVPRRSGGKHVIQTSEGVIESCLCCITHKHTLLDNKRGEERFTLTLPNGTDTCLTRLVGLNHLPPPLLLPHMCLLFTLQVQRLPHLKYLHFSCKLSFREYLQGSQNDFSAFHSRKNQTIN